MPFGDISDKGFNRQGNLNQEYPVDRIRDVRSGIRPWIRMDRVTVVDNGVNDDIDYGMRKHPAGRYTIGC